MRCRRLLPLLSSCALAAVSLAPAGASASPKNARIHVQPPFDLNNPGATRLDSIESYGAYPLLSRDFEIPYSTIEAKINAELKAFGGQAGDVEVCTDPCPDVTWSVNITPSFKFTKKNQPVLTAVGSSSANKVRVELTTQARLDVHADVHAETWFDTVDVPVDIYIVVGLKAAVEVDLWPVIQVHKPGSNEEGVELTFTLDERNIDLQLNGAAVALGAKWGTLIGLSPVGLLVGGPLLGPLLAIIGNEAADMAEAAISDIFYARVQSMFESQTGSLEEMVNHHILPYVSSANAAKDRLMNSKIKGVNKTLSELSSSLGATVALHTVTPGGGVATSAVVRMSAAPGAGKIKGVVRMPKEACEYAHISSGPLKGATIPLGLKPTNLDLASKVGQPCSAVIGAALPAHTYLGANPRTVLGPTAQDLPSWKDVSGKSQWTGALTQADKWYECAFEVTSLPTAGIVRLEGRPWLGQHRVDIQNKRYFEAKIGAQVVLDLFMSPVKDGLVVFGGAGQCGAGGGGRGLIPSKLKALQDLLNPEKCPQCGLKALPGMEHVLEITNPQAFLETTLGRQLLKTVEADRAPSGRAGMRQPAARH